MNWTYWAGQALILVPVAIRLLGRRMLKPATTIVLILILTVAEYLLKICYSPLAFTFPDELLHWRSTLNVLHGGTLYITNYALPIGPGYPGLEEATSALMSVTGLPLFAAGLVVAGIAHLVFIFLLYLLFQGISRSHRMAGIAMLLYSGTPGLSSFNSMFVYETLALAFMGLAVLAAWRGAAQRSAGERAGWFIVAVVAITATVITHHVTSYFLVAALALVTVTSFVMRYRRSAVWLATLTVISASLVTFWIAVEAPGTISYFSPTVGGILRGFSALLAGGSHQASAGSPVPLGDQALEGLTFLAVGAVLPIAWRHVWLRCRRQPWIVGMAIASAGWYGTIVVRFAAMDGQELAGRAATFIFIPVSFLTMIAVIRIMQAARRRRLASLASASALAGTLALLVNGQANGWPPYWERLPGTYLVDGYERSVAPEELAASTWFLTVLGPGNRFAADAGTYPVIASYGDQNPVRAVAYLYTSATYSAAVARRARAQGLKYVLVDRRLSESLPAAGKYFPVDPNAGRYTRPLPQADLAKFDHSAAIARIYDSGNIVVYRLRGAPHAP